MVILWFLNIHFVAQPPLPGYLLIIVIVKNMLEYAAGQF